MNSIVTWAGKMAFDADIEGFVVPMDADPEVGGTHHGPRPKGLVLTALGGCTSMDVVSILQKMRVPIESLEVEVTGDVADEHPKVFTAIAIAYRFTGTDLPLARLQRAVELSQDRYCPVSAMLKPVVPIHWEIWVNGERQERLPSAP